jgi:hypothetical protein
MSNQLKGKAIPVQAISRLLWFQEFEDPRLLDGRHMEVVRLTALRTGRLNPPRKYSWYLISVRGWVDPGAVVWPEGLIKWTVPVTPSGIEPATFRLAAQCLNKLRLHDHNNNVNYKLLKLLGLLKLLTLALLSRIVDIVMVVKGKLCLFIFVYIFLK